MISESLDTAFTANSNEVDTIRYRFSKEFGTIESNVDNSGIGLLLRASPYFDSHPLFKISDTDSNDYISSNPYYISNTAWDGHTKLIKLLGFFTDNPCDLYVINDTVCSETDYSFPDGTFVSNITSNLTHINSLISTVNGNDSIIYTNLIVKNSVTTYDTISTNSAIFWNGLYLDTSGDYSVDLTSSLDCDSIVNLNLTIIENPSNLNDYVGKQKKVVKVTDVLGQNQTSHEILYSFIFMMMGQLRKKYS